MAVKKFTVGAVSRKQNYGHYGVKVDGTDKWVNVKSIDGIERGAVLKAEIVTKKGRLYASNVKVIKEGQASGGNGGGYRGKGGGNYQRNDNVDWNAAHARAIEVVDLLIKHDAAKLGAKTKVEERKTAILDMIDELTAKYFKEITARTALKKAKEIDEDLGDEDSDDDSDVDGDDDDESMDDDDADVDSDEGDDDDDPFED